LIQLHMKGWLVTLMRKISYILFSILMAATLTAGCSRANQAGSSQGVEEGSTTVIDTAKLEQFQEPAKGDTIAEIIIRDYGSIYVRFFEEAAPKAVENFVTHARNGYYDGVTFHRIIKDFMIQGGDPTGTGRGGESIWGESFEDEFVDTLQPYRGALCMANSGPDTNGSQFFLVQSTQTYDEKILDKVEAQYRVEFDAQARKAYSVVGGTPWLYQLHTVFGQIYKGYEVLDAVVEVEMKDARNGIPANEVVIETIKVSEFE
jgi:peptidyl-prolyl cis-trans isomerase B (cyclophilin B)